MGDIFYNRIEGTLRPLLEKSRSSRNPLWTLRLAADATAPQLFGQIS